MRSAGDFALYILWFGGVTFLLGAGLTYALATTSLRAASVLLVGSIAVFGVMLLLGSSADTGECGVVFLILTSLQVMGWLLGALLGWGLRLVFRR